MIRRALGLLFAAVVLAGCGEEPAGKGAATLWVTRDRGNDVMLSVSVPAGISAMEALRRKTEVETRHGGRFVQAIDGVEGSIADRRDWFFYVNGYEGDRSASDYRLHDGDVLWFDHRSWAKQLRVPVVVGAFPEPFVHGFDGNRRPTVVEGPGGKTAKLLARLVGGSVGGSVEGANRLVLVRRSGFRARLTGAPGDPVLFELGLVDARRLVRDPTLARYRYEGLR
ncbi:MAG: DUF4430 domain-containing protein [Actinobacteria bacterium]|nr:DUF4430 domain-containing protein [Actinomycetota bacterium]